MVGGCDNTLSLFITTLDGGDKPVHCAPIHPHDACPRGWMDGADPGRPPGAIPTAAPTRVA